MDILKAAYKGYIKDIKKMLAAGADVNAKSDKGRTPLHCAAERGHKEIVELLIAAGADVNAKFDNGETPLDFAVLFNKKEIADILRKQGGKHKNINNAAESGDVEGVTEFLAAGADVNAKSDKRRTPLHCAAERGHKEIVDLLIAAGADVNAKIDYGETPLDLAKLYHEIAELLQKNGGKSGAEDSIFVATINRNLEAVKRHLEAGVDVNEKDNQGNTPLDLISGDRSWGSSYEYWKNDDEIRILLLKHGGKHGSIYSAVRHGDVEGVKEFLASSTDVNAKNEDGNTILHFLILDIELDFSFDLSFDYEVPQSLFYERKKPIMELTIAEGADVNAKDEGGRWQHTARFGLQH